MRTQQSRMAVFAVFLFTFMYFYHEHVVEVFSADRSIQNKAINWTVAQLANLKVFQAESDPQIPANCACMDKDGKEYNMCYVNSNNLTMIGKRFDCKYLEEAKRLGLFDTNYIDLSRDEMPDPQFVTALSGNHIDEGRRQLKNLHKFWPKRTIVVFDLGLEKQHRKEYENDPLVDLRDFPFDRYPKYTRKLFEYRWKGIMIAEMVKEFGAIFYIDASIMFHDSDLSPVYNLYRCKNNHSSTTKNVSHPKYLGNTNIDVMLKSCNKSSSILFHSRTFHSIYATTQAGMYDYLPMNMDMAKKVVMRESNSMTIVRTKEAVENIIRWFALCGMEENCMGPPGAKLPCSFKDALKDFANCHRYDQSIVNILAANRFNGEINRYQTELHGYLTVERLRK